jgi:ethanolamine utilization protein EutN
MILAKVIGNVVATRKEEGLVGFKILLVQSVDPDTEAVNGAPFVAVDTLGAGMKDLVLVVTGGGARVFSDMHREAPLDAAIVGIVDTVDVFK